MSRILNNFGLENENMICNAFNGHTYEELNENLQRVVDKLFPEINEDDVFQCHLTDNFIKPDIVLSSRGRNCFISIKTDHSLCMHTESIDSFISFLESLNVSEETLTTIRLFQFGDGTTDGSGERRMNYEEVYRWLGEKIAKANRELNDRIDLIEKVVDRVMFQGVDLLADSADYIYVGTVDYGVLVSKRQIKSVLRKNNWHFYDNLHIGPIMLRPHARYANRTIISDDRRRHVMFSWARFNDEILYMTRHFYF